MDNVSWFDSYPGPKRIMVEPGQASCWIELNIVKGSGRVVGKELYTYGPTLRQALAEARAVYESIANRMRGSDAPRIAKSTRAH